MRSSATARRWLTAGPTTPASTRTRIARYASPPGSSRRSLALRSDAVWAGRPGGATGTARAARALLLHLRPEPDDARLAAIRRVPRVVVEELPARQVHEPAHAGRARRLAVLLDHRHALEERRVGDPLYRRRPRLLQGASLRDDAAVDRRPVQVNDERRRADERADQQPVRCVVDEAEIDVRVVHRRIAALRVVADVERMVRPGGDLHAGFVGGVEDRRGNLADAAAEPRRQLAVDDHRRFEEALVGGARARRVVEGERRSGSDELAVD